MLKSLKKCQPKVGRGVYLADSADVVGDVEIGDNSSVWFRVVIRGDVMPIRIGKETSIQDGTVIHGTYKKCGVTIGDRVTVGHGVILHGCEVGDGCLVGMGSILMDHVKVAPGCLIAAGTLLTEGTVIDEPCLVMGRPGRVKRKLTAEESAFLQQSADNYLQYKKWYQDNGGENG